MNITLILLFSIIGLIALLSVFYYNLFVKNKYKIKNAWSDIDVFLKKRFDLIPNLVETVKAYAIHEKDVLENIVKYRNSMQNNNASMQDRIASETKLTSALQGFYAVVENYPDLKSNQNFILLQNSLTDIENDIENARRYFNAVVRIYNTSLEMFPSLLFAKMFGFKTEVFFETETSERENVKIKFN